LKKESKAKANRGAEFTEEDLAFLWLSKNEMFHGLPPETFERLLPTGGLVPWVKPAPALEIDNAVEQLLARPRAPRIPVAPDAPDKCPYTKARNGVAHAAVSAYLAAGYRDLFRREEASIKEIGADLREARDALVRLVGPFSFPRNPEIGRWLDIRGAALPGAARSNRSDGEARARSFGEALPVLRQAVIALEAIERNLNVRAAEIDPATSLHVQWRDAFVEDLGGLWFSLTGRDPSSAADSPFVAFVRAAFVSIGGTDLVTWEHATRKVIERVAARPEWDRFDRWARGRLPPGVEPDSPEARHAREEQIAASTVEWLAQLVGRAKARMAGAEEDLTAFIGNRGRFQQAALSQIVQAWRAGDLRQEPEHVLSVLAARAEDAKNSRGS